MLRIRIVKMVAGLQNHLIYNYNSSFSSWSFSNRRKLQGYKKECHYKILNISTNSTPQQIKNAYYDLAKIHHPDIHKEQDISQINIENSETRNGLKFSDIREAYDILVNTGSREEYDESIGLRPYSIRNIEHSSRISESRSRNNMREEERIEEKMMRYKTLSDYKNTLNRHRETHKERSKLRTDGWEELNDIFGSRYDHYNSVEREKEGEYNRYREMYEDNYFASKEEHSKYEGMGVTKFILNQFSEFYKKVKLL